MQKSDDHTPVSDTPLAEGIVTNPHRRHGAPTLAGTRITVDDVLERITAGRSIDEIVDAFRYVPVTRRQVLQALAYARMVYTRATTSVGSHAGDEASGGEDTPWN
jgi:uncharacterized protein (DUF433 family)